MEHCGNFQERTVYYLCLDSEANSVVEQMDNWICFAIASGQYPKDKAVNFIRHTLLGGMLEFKAQGAHAEELHLLCDSTMVSLEVDEGHPIFDIVTTGSASTDLANAFWECFFATVLPDRADYDDLKVVCVSFDGTNYRSRIDGLLDRFEEGWVPSD